MLWEFAFIIAQYISLVIHDMRTALSSVNINQKTIMSKVI